MELSDFDFTLPEALIAQRPSVYRDQSRLLDLPHRGAPSFRRFNEIIEAFRGDEVLVLNDTRVVPARIIGQKESGGKLELFFLESRVSGEIFALTRGKLRVDQPVLLPGDVQGRFLGRDESGVARLSLSGARFTGESIERWEAQLFSWLEEIGEVPLPPYIERNPEEEDGERYQTVFARCPGAVAAPTAGLHFTEELLAALAAKGVTQTTLTLHVGLGTFAPIRGPLAEHQMHRERYQIPPETWALIQSGRPVVSVGTTALRALESEARIAIQRESALRETELFIRPGFEFKVVDGLITNFHLPRSTLFMLVSAFLGLERAREAYAAAIAEGLRFYSYGDACLFRRPDGRWRD